MKTQEEAMHYEKLYQELANGAEIIRQLVAGITREEAQRRPTPESWSILEVICHLHDEEVEDFRQRLDIILHRLDEPWPPIDPVGWVTARTYNANDLEESLQKLLSERKRSLEWLRSLSAPDWEIECATTFGRMKAGDMLSSWVAHDNLHIRQLVELRRARIIVLTLPYDVRYAGEW